MSALSASWENTLQRVKELSTLNMVYLYLTPSVTLDIPRNTNHTNQLSLSQKLTYRKCFHTRFVKKDSSNIYHDNRDMYNMFLEGGIIFSKLTHAQPNSLLVSNFRRLHISSKKVSNINCNNSVKMCDLRGLVISTWVCIHQPFILFSQ